MQKGECRCLWIETRLPWVVISSHHPPMVGGARQRKLSFGSFVSKSISLNLSQKNFTPRCRGGDPAVVCAAADATHKKCKIDQNKSTCLIFNSSFNSYLSWRYLDDKCCCRPVVPLVLVLWGLKSGGTVPLGTETDRR